MSTWRHYRLWVGGMLAGAAMAAALAALGVPFLGLSAGQAAGYVAVLLVLAEALAAAALIVLGKDIYRALRAKVESLKSSLDER